MLVETFNNMREFNCAFPSKLFICSLCGALCDNPYTCDRCGFRADGLFKTMENGFKFRILETSICEEIFKPIELFVR